MIIFNKYKQNYHDNNDNISYNNILLTSYLTILISYSYNNHLLTH